MLEKIHIDRRLKLIGNRIAGMIQARRMNDDDDRGLYVFYFYLN